MVYFGGVVILPLWLQTQMNYTPTWAGLVTAPLGIIPVMLSPFMGRIMNYIDLRIIVSIGFTVFATCSFWQSSLSTDVGPTTIALIRLIQGIGSPCFFIPLITILFSGLPDKSVASAAGLSNFLRILAGSFGTSISVTLWAHREAVQQSKLVEYVTSYDVPLHNAITQLQSLGFTLKASYAQIYAMVTNQSYMLATNDIFWLSGYIFISLIILIWFAKPPFLTKGKAVLSE
jgi:DHA2 family multidrug resistance protein